MKKLQNNNKGFSLVELIIVIAIMAVLMTVLAPQFLRYVERSRLQSDNTTIGEIANACKVAATDEDVVAAIAADSAGLVLEIPVAPTVGAVTIQSGGDGGAGDTALLNELTLTVGSQLSLGSNTYITGTAPTITLTIDGNNTITITGNDYVEEVGLTGAAHVF